MVLTEFDRRIVLATQSGLPLVARPYEALAAMLGTSSERVCERLSALRAQGLILRIGAIAEPSRVGCRGQALSVWDVDDAQIDILGPRVAALAGVQRCERGPRHASAWPYNLFVSVHARTPEEVEHRARAIRELLGPACRGGELLFTAEVLKQTGLRLRER